MEKHDGHWEHLLSCLSLRSRGLTENQRRAVNFNLKRPRCHSHPAYGFRSFRALCSKPLLPPAIGDKTETGKSRGHLVAAGPRLKAHGNGRPWWTCPMVVCLFSSDGWGEGNTGNLTHQFPGRVIKGTGGFVRFSPRVTASVRVTQMLCRAETVRGSHPRL